MQEPTLLHLGLQVFGIMKEGGSEIQRVVHRVAMLPIRQVTLNDLHKGGIVKQALAQTIESRGEARNAYGQQETSRTQDTMRFTKGSETICPLGQMIQRTEQEHDIDAFVRTLQAASVTDLYLCEGSVWLCSRSLPCQFHMQGNRIDEMHFIALFRQPAGIHARTTTDIKNH